MASNGATSREAFCKYAFRVASSLENSNKVTPPGQLERILGVSSSTLDRVLTPFRISEAKRKKTSSLTALRSNIPLVDIQRSICTLGYFYADTVEHCRTKTKEDFAWTLTLNDDYTQWVRCLKQEQVHGYMWVMTGSQNGSSYYHWGRSRSSEELDHFLWKDKIPTSAPYQGIIVTDNY